MGFELDAFIGRASELRKWERQLTSTVVCQLSGDLGMVPMTGELLEELRIRLGWEKVSPFDAARQYLTYASGNTTIAYVSASEFGDSSHEFAVLWSNGKEIPFKNSLGDVLRYLRDQAGIRLEVKDIELEKYRGETAAEKWAAAAVLQQLAGWSETPVAALIRALLYERRSKTIQDLVRQFAADRLAALGPSAKEAIPALERTLKTEQDFAICIAAASALAAIGPEAVPALMDILSDAVYEKQAAILLSLGKLGPAAQEAVPVLINVVRSEIPYDFLGVRREAADTLGKIGPGARAAVPALVDALKDNNWTVRSHAADALAGIGAAARASVPALVEALKDKEWAVRSAAVGALVKIGPSSVLDGVAIPFLIEALRDEETYMRMAAARVLGSTGAAAHKAVPAMVKALWDKEAYVPPLVMEALKQIGSTAAAIPKLILMLKTAKSPRRRSTAAELLGKVGSKAGTAIPALVNALRDGDEGVRLRAARALGNMGPVARTAIPALEESLQQGDEYFRKVARDSLESIREPSK